MIRESSKSILVEELKAQAKSLGFSRVGIAAVSPSIHIDFYQSWIDAGMQGEMRYLAREESVKRRGDVEQTLPGARSVIVVTHDYLTEDLGCSPDDPTMAIVARYARGDDYHDIIKSKLLGLLKWLSQRVPERVEGRARLVREEYDADRPNYRFVLLSWITPDRSRAFSGLAISRRSLWNVSFMS